MTDEGGRTEYQRGYTDGVIAAREAVIQECAHVAFQAYGSLTRDQYVMEGPAGLAKRMIGAIKALSSQELRPPNPED
jgi:hypothetical protein